MDISYSIWPKADLGAIAHVLDTSGHEARLGAVADFGRREMAHLFDAAADNPKTTLEDFVPADCPPMMQVIHYGKSSLPVFTHFQKRFCRPPVAEAPGELWGYNEQELRAITGPGYFVAYLAEEGGVVIDYTRVPPKRPVGWPRVSPNSTRLACVVYDGTKDCTRRLSRHVTIGRARCGGHDMDAWFILIREVPRVTHG